MTQVESPDYTLRHPSEVVAILERLRREKTLVTMEYGDGHALISTVLAVRDDRDLLLLDVSRDRSSNRALFAAPSVSFVTELDHIQIAFESGTPMKGKFGDGPAAVVDMPTVITRLQRREWYRATLPHAPPVRCTVLDGTGNASPAQAVDLSCGGAAVVVDDVAFDPNRTGLHHELVISLPEVGQVALDATLRAVRPTTGLVTADTGKIRLGFRFEQLPPRTSNQIQRYVQRLEVEQLRVLRLRGR